MSLTRLFLILDWINLLSNLKVNLTFKFDNWLIHCNIKNNRKKLILLGVKLAMLCISKTEITCHACITSS